LLGGSEPKPSAELESTVCEITGCHANTLAAVKKELGVESYQSGRQWFCRLSGQNSSEHNKPVKAAEPVNTEEFGIPRGQTTIIPQTRELLWSDDHQLSAEEVSYSLRWFHDYFSARSFRSYSASLWGCFVVITS
jgi:hypothetical protein